MSEWLSLYGTSEFLVLLDHSEMEERIVRGETGKGEKWALKPKVRAWKKNKGILDWRNGKVKAW